MIKVAATIKVKLPQAAIEKHLPDSPYIVGEELAKQVNEYVHNNHLGYYPALEFFQHQVQGVDGDLLETAENIAWLVANLVREEVRVRLKPVFSNVNFESIQSKAFTMPSIRIGQSNALHELTRHYTPDQVQINLILTLIQKNADEDAALQLTEKMIYRWLKECFASIKVTSIWVV